MSPTKDRHRAAARARLEREMAARQDAARRRRQIQIGIASGAAVLLVIVGTVWLVTRGGDGKGTPTANPSESTKPTGCTWIPENRPTPSPGGPSAPPVAPIKDVGTPPTSGEPRTGTRTLTISTNLGDIKVQMDLAKAPCVAANFAHLSEKNFYNDTRCHRAFEGMLQCGDPSVKAGGPWKDSDGTGGPSYRFAAENLPVDERPAYPRGTMAMANASTPTSDGSQFFFIYKDTGLNGPNYSVVGTITQGLELLDDVGKAGHDGKDGAQEGHPKKDVVIKSVTLSPVQS